MIVLSCIKSMETLEKITKSTLSLNLFTSSQTQISNKLNKTFSVGEHQPTFIASTSTVEAYGAGPEPQARAAARGAPSPRGSASPRSRSGTIRSRGGSTSLLPPPSRFLSSGISHFFMSRRNICKYLYLYIYIY